MNEFLSGQDKMLIVVRGGGDIASGTIARLHHCGFRVVVLEQEHPSAIRRSVSFSEAIYDGRKTVEGVTAERVSSFADCAAVWACGDVPVLIDPCCQVLGDVHPVVLIDAILAKKNCGMTRAMADLSIALGPGFSAGDDADIVIETARGHHLGQLIRSGRACANTGVPGEIAGVSRERVVHAPCRGILTIVCDIGCQVKRGDLIAEVDDMPVFASIDGVVRGMIRNHFEVARGLKIADIDPREEESDNCFTISDKARCISGGVLEAILSWHQKYKLPYIG